MREIVLLALLASVAACADRNEEELFADDFEVGHASLVELREYGNLARRSLGEGDELLIVCGPWAGQSKFVSPDLEEWVADGASQGRIAFAVLANGEPEVIYRDALGSTITAREDGAEAQFVGELSSEAFTISASYPSTGNAEIYSVFRNSGGGPRLLWATVKVRGISTRISGFESDCIDYAQTY